MTLMSFEAAHDAHISLAVHCAQIAGVQPAGAIDRLGSAYRFIPVTLHHRIAPAADFARLTDRHDAAILADELDLQMRTRPPNRLDLLVQGIILGGLVIDRTRFGLAIGDQHFGHVHVGLHSFHDFDRTGCACHDAGAQARKVEFTKARMFQFCDEHGRHAMQRGAASRPAPPPQASFRIEAIVWKYRRGTVTDARKIAHHHAEAVVERHGDA
jgi:hypothetical protein